MTDTQARAAAQRIVADLFTNGNGLVADRLVLTTDDNRDLGGWGRGPAEARILRGLEAVLALQPADGATFVELVEAELRRARLKNHAMRTRHEALAVILEEFEEFKAEVFKREADPAELLAELVQVAAMCQRAAEDLQLGVAVYRGGLDFENPDR